MLDPVKSLLRWSGVALLAGTLAPTPRLLAAEKMSGYSRNGAARQKALETSFLALPSTERIRGYHRLFTSEPHPAGSARNNELARVIAAEWEKQGWEDVHIRRYDVLSSLPREVSVEMIRPVRYRPSLREDGYGVDPDTRQAKVHGAYLGFSASGDVTAPVVYANSGNPDDYALLRRQGIDPRGKIAVVRYSQPYSYRGFKALTAEREGVAALIIYSDPAEDGYKKGAVFPEGPWGPASHIQRGAITYDFMVPGDPLTPGWASVPGARRIPIGEAVSVPKVIALPMSWRDMQPILEKLDGPKAPDAWQGGLPLTYRLGGKKVRLHVKVSMRKTIRPNYVVEARLRGADYPDEWIVMGNHRDAWEFGGVDPSSGTAAMMELSRVLGEMKQMGFRPRRTLVIASWDGEEDALTGSTEWGEQFAEDLRTKAVAYINVDSAASGPDFRPGAVASLAPLVVEVSRGIPAPSGRSLYKEWKKSVAAERRGKEDSPPVRDDNLVDTKIGSGSDHTVFLNFLGRPIINLDFDGPYGVYHSVYDDYFWMNHFGDPGYRYHQTATRLWGVLALRLANAELLPFDFEFYAEALDGFIAEVEKKPEAQARLDWARLHQAVAELRAAGKDLRLAAAGALRRETPPAAVQQGVNKAINQVEANWLNTDGIPGRPWFKHVLYAARYTYAHLELPGLTEAVERGDWPAAATQAYILQSAISRNADLLRQTAGELAPAHQD